MLSVVCIPAFNVANQISEVIKKSQNYVDQVIVCDDGSSDETYVNAESSGAFVIKHKVTNEITHNH